MNYFSIIKYYPDTVRSEGFGIGLIILNEEDSYYRIKISDERLKRINKIFGIKKSPLLDYILEDLRENHVGFSKLKLLSIYENGVIQFSHPKMISSEDIDERFNYYYDKFVADYNELPINLSNDNAPNNIKRPGYKLRNHFKKSKFINDHLNIGYKFEGSKIADYFVDVPKIDFIGGNGSIFAGELINLETSEETFQENLSRIITLYRALEKSFLKLFIPNECKILLLQDQVNNSPNAELYMDKLQTWHKNVGFDLMIKDTVVDFSNEIEKTIHDKDIIKFEDWILQI